MEKIIIERHALVKDNHIYKLIYYLFESCQVIDSIGEQVVYGLKIKMIIDDSLKDVKVDVVTDICTSMDTAMELFQLVSKNQVFPVHLCDVVIDFIS